MATIIYKTSEYWSKEFPNIKILDPDGWDRTNFHYSWYEEGITQGEFKRRMSMSTCQKLK